ncbi:MAG TPA: tryptophan synthase subunit alpha [Pseudonocardia sp.]|nr:tryptophan synthase subunit alpha [Pseudonocardia sp.]
MLTHLPGTDRLGARRRAAEAAGDRLLVVYLTLADPLTSGPPGLAPVLAAAGVDVLELGLPTPGTRPRGAVVGASFERAMGTPLARVWAELSELRSRLPDVPIVLLVYPETVTDIGWPALLAECGHRGVDGMVLTRPSVADLHRVSAAGFSAIPLIPPNADRGFARDLEEAASGLTYRPLAARTGDPLEPDSVGRLAARLDAEAATPFIVGFGIRNEREIRAAAPHVAGVVIGSEFLARISEVPESGRTSYTEHLIRRWKSATRLAGAAAAGPES